MRTKVGVGVLMCAAGGYGCMGEVSSNDGYDQPLTSAVSTPQDTDLVFSKSGGSTNEIQNAGFEDWAGGAPTGWTVIDTGLQLSESTSQAREGSSSAAVNVTTGSQASTDLRQTIQVSSGTHTITVWVKHTEGGMKARLYANGYHGYSNPNLVGQWQQLSQNITVSSSTSIEVGLRFYDVSGFDGAEVVYVDDFQPAASGSGGSTELTGYYAAANGAQGYALKTALHNIIKNHNSRSYNNLWSFMSQNDRDYYYENDGKILDVYSENPNGSEIEFSAGSDQCGYFNSEGDCYNREHSFPKSWFGGAVAPMNSDVHHIFPTDGRVNQLRGNYPFGEVGGSAQTTNNGSKLGSAASGSGYSGTVFEPIDAFKGDLARAYFYMATRYEDKIDNWENNGLADAVLDGSDDQVFEPWFLDLLIAWHEADPVSDKERDRNDDAYSYQQNRNPFVDHPELVQQIWD